MPTDYVSDRPLRQALSRLKRGELLDRMHALRALGAVRGMRFLDDQSRPRLIEISLKPWIVTPRQLAFFRTVALNLADGLMRLTRLYADHPAVRAVLTFDARQESWIRLSGHPRSRPMAVIGRLDSIVLFSHAAWRTSFRMLEPNAVGVGGVHYGPTINGIILETLEDLLAKAYPGRFVQVAPDPRALLLEELQRVAGARGRRLTTVALIENQDYTTGTDEFSHLARYLTEQGLRAIVCDPRHFVRQRGRVVVKGTPIDLIYRDCELAEFIEMEDAGHRLTALRQMIREGRMVSGLLWEFDQKSSWEIFTDPAYAPYFTPAQRRLFRKHLLWTRLVREAFVSNEQGRQVDLPAYIRRNKDGLVLKPNTLYGGSGVVVGRAVSQDVWENTLRLALTGEERYVVQRLARFAVDTVGVLEDGRPRFEERCTVCGFFFNSLGVSVIGRFSREPVVNVSRGGGMVPALLVR